MVLSSSDSSQRGTRPPPAGAICISDKAIHHPHCSARFSVVFFFFHQTAWGSAEQLYMYMLVMRALETCLVALQPASRAEGNQWINPLGWTRTHPLGFFPKRGIQQHMPHCGEGRTKLRGEWLLQFLWCEVRRAINSTSPCFSQLRFSLSLINKISKDFSQRPRIVALLFSRFILFIFLLH